MRFEKWLQNHIANLKLDLVAKSKSADIDTIRYIAGQINEAEAILTVYDQLRKEGSTDG